MRRYLNDHRLRGQRRYLWEPSPPVPEKAIRKLYIEYFSRALGQKRYTPCAEKRTCFKQIFWKALRVVVQGDDVIFSGVHMVYI
jgi:hypothetical protein